MKLSPSFFPHTSKIYLEEDEPNVLDILKSAPEYPTIEYKYDENTLTAQALDFHDSAIYAEKLKNGYVLLKRVFHYYSEHSSLTYFYNGKINIKETPLFIPRSMKRKLYDKGKTFPTRQTIIESAELLDKNAEDNPLNKKLKQGK